MPNPSKAYPAVDPCFACRVEEHHPRGQHCESPSRRFSDVSSREGNPTIDRGRILRVTFRTRLSFEARKKGRRRKRERTRAQKPHCFSEFFSFFSLTISSLRSAQYFPERRERAEPGEQSGEKNGERGREREERGAGGLNAATEKERRRERRDYNKKKEKN